jgi:Glycosyl transferases group 1
VAVKRIFYECRDVPHPSGGVRRLYRHVEILNKNGFSAFIVHHSSGFKPSWFEVNVPTLYWSDGITIDSEDVLVIPEGHTDIMMRTRNDNYRRIVIALNWANIYAHLPVGTDWRQLGIKHVISGSLYEQEFIRRSMGLSSVVIPSGVDLSLFNPRKQKIRQIAYMPRKNEKWFHIIAAIFRSQNDDLSSVPFVAIDKVSHREVARILCESAVFLATGFPEGLARPPIEAMAAGCIVVGFAGRGSLEYMQHGCNCLLADDMDALTAAEHLGAAVRLFGTPEAKEFEAAALQTAARYSLEREESNVVQYWTKFFSETLRASPETVELGKR